MLLYKDYLKTDLWNKNRKAALLRDDFKCVRCGSAKNLELHHIRYPADFNNDTEDNIITLCANCHRKIHENDFHAEAISRVGISEEEYTSMTVMEYARLLAASVDVTSMTLKELGSYARIITKETTVKFNKTMNALSVINGGNRIVSLEKYAGGLLDDVLFIHDLYVSYWLSNVTEFCPSFEIDTDYVEHGLKKQEQEYIKKTGLSRREVEERYIYPFVNKDWYMEQKEYNDEWWDDILPKVRISAAKIKQFISSRGIDYSNKTQIRTLLHDNSVWEFLLYLDKNADVGHYFAKNIELALNIQIEALTV